MAFASQYADLLGEAKASALLCKECTLLVRIQLSNKNVNHADCAFADSMSTSMCGAMISLTPCNAAKLPRDCDLHESVEFRDATDMIQKLNDRVAAPDGFPQIPVPRKDCNPFYAKENERHKQYVICPEQDCEWLVYMSDQNASMVEALGVHDHPLWAQRVQDYHDWQKKANKGVKTSKNAWVWEEGSSSKWSTASTRGSSKRGQSVPVDPSKRTNPEEKGLPWRDLGEIGVRPEYLYPEDASIPCPAQKVEQLSPAKQATNIQWIVQILKLDHRVDKDPRVYCSYCDMNNHPRFTCKHAWKHRNPLEKHHCSLCAAKHLPILCLRAEVNGGPGLPNWYKYEYKRAKQENREADYRWGPSLVSHVDVNGPECTSQPPSEAPHGPG